MSSAISNTELPIDFSDEKPKDLKQENIKDTDSGSTECIQDDIERASSPELEDGIVGNEKDLHAVSIDSKRPPLSRIASRLTTHSFTDPGPPPDGGLKAWTQVAMSWCAVLATWGWVNCYGVFQTYYTLHLDVSASTISWIGTVQTFLSFFIGAFSGRLLDAGYFFPTIITGMTLQLLGIFLMSLCTKYWQLMLTQGLLTGIGGGIFFMPCMGLVATYFSRRRAFAMGIASTGNSAGGLVYPVIVRELLPKVGFAWTVRVLGFVNLALLATILTFMRPRLPPRKSGPILDLAAFKELHYTLFTIAVFFQMWCIYFTLYYVTSFGVQAIGLSFTTSTSFLIIVNGIGIPGRLLTGRIADSLGQLNTILPLSCILVVITWSWLAVHTEAGIYIYVCLYGLFVASFQCLLPPTIASLTEDMKTIGSRLGMVFSIAGFAALTGPPIGGALIEAMGGSYLGAQCWSASACLVCLVTIAVTRTSRAKGKVKVKV